MIHLDKSKPKVKENMTKVNEKFEAKNKSNHKIEKRLIGWGLCKRCGKLRNLDIIHTALSRRKNGGHICSSCGTEEGMIDFKIYRMDKEEREKTIKADSKWIGNEFAYGLDMITLKERKPKYIK